MCRREGTHGCCFRGRGEALPVAPFLGLLACAWGSLPGPPCLCRVCPLQLPFSQPATLHTLLLSACAPDRVLLHPTVVGRPAPMPQAWHRLAVRPAGVPQAGRLTSRVSSLCGGATPTLHQQLQQLQSKSAYGQSLVDHTINSPWFTASADPPSCSTPPRRRLPEALPPLPPSRSACCCC
jgi:hypothetical protein